MRHTLTAAVFVLLASAPAVLACPLCKDSVPASDAQSAGGLPGGFNNSIYLMLGSLFCVIGMITWTLVKGVRSADASSVSHQHGFDAARPKK